MATKVEKWYPGEAQVKPSPIKIILYILTGLGILSGIIRLFLGLGLPLISTMPIPGGCGSALMS